MAENPANAAEQTGILDLLAHFEPLQRRIESHTAAIVTDVGTAYVDRIEIRCGFPLSRHEFQRLAAQLAVETPYLVESVRWRHVGDDLVVLQFTLITPIPNPT